MHASKHFDPQIGIDIHFCEVGFLPDPIPLPTIHLSIVFDGADYVPFIGATVEINGVKRATAGTVGHSIHIPFMPYFPLFEPEEEEGPQNKNQLFMGSKTVVADGNPLSRITMPVLSCNFIGMINPFRPKKPQFPQRSLSLPTTINLAIPNNVMVGGPPTIIMPDLSLQGLAMSALGNLGKLGKLKKLKRVEAALEKAHGRWRKMFEKMDSGFLKCKILHAEPVDIRTGSVEVTHEDFSIPGRLPLVWTRRYRSDDSHSGLCGHGWQTPADTRLMLDVDGSVLFLGPSGVVAIFERVPQFLRDDVVEDSFDGVRLKRVAGSSGHELHLQTKDDVVYVFDAPVISSAYVNNLGAVSDAQLLPIQRLQDLHGNYWRFERQDNVLLRINESGIDGAQGRFLDVSVQRGHIHHIALHDPAAGITYPLVRYGQDTAGDLVAVYDALDAARTFEYQAAPHPHHMVRHTDRVGLSFYYEYDNQARVVHAWGDGGLHNYRFAYNTLISETEVTDSLGHVTHVKFDGNGLPLCEINPLGGCTFFEYDDWARTTAVTDAEGLRTEFKYDERGNLIQLTRPDASALLTDYDTDNRPVAITDPAGARWLQGWDARGQLVEQTSPLGSKSRYDYDDHGQLVQQTNPRGAMTVLAFDRHGQLQQVTDALGHSGRFEHDAMGNLLERTDASGARTRYQYDRKSRLIQATLPGGAIISCEYDAEDQLVRYVDESGHETKLEYVGIGQVARRLQPDGHSVRYQYDTEEQLTTVINQRGERYGLQRDALGRIVTETDYWGQSRQYSYDAAGRIRRSVDPLGRGITFETDKLGRITRKTFADVVDATRQTVETFRYDIAGNLVEMGNAHSKVTRRFDPEGRLIEEVQNGFKVHNEYDAVGSRILRTTSAGNRVAVEYDLRDAPTRITINGESPIVIERDAQGRAITEQLSPQLRRSFAYKESGLLAAQTVYKDVAPLFDTCFDYDRSGNLTKRVDSEFGTDTYHYDPMGRVTEHLDPTGKLTQWLNDPVGDRLQTHVREAHTRKVVGSENRTEWTREGSHNGINYVFDRAGNLVTRTYAGNIGQPVLHLSWDANNRLCQSQWSGGDMDGQSTTYAYDPLGRRVLKHGPNETTHFFWDDDMLLAELSNDNKNGAHSSIAAIDVYDEQPARKIIDLNVAKAKAKTAEYLHRHAREYVYRSDTFEPMVRIEPAAVADDLATNPFLNILYHFSNDLNGSPMRLTTSAGEICWAATDTAWGKTAAFSRRKFIQPIRLQGQYEDLETGLHYNRHRYFDPDTGQFVGQDPLGLDAGDSLYEYAANTRTWLDPLGLEKGRGGKQARLRELMDDDKQPRHVRGWVRQEVNSINSGSTNKRGNKRTRIRNPPGYDMAHYRGYEAAKGFDYDHSQPNFTKLHKLQHKYDDHGKKNKLKASGKCLS